MRAPIVCLALTLAAGPALADSGENKAAAAAAFDAGKKAMAAGQTADACEQFQKSQDLDPEFGTEYNLALCYEALGKLASAYGEFDELAGKDTNAKRKASSKDHAAKLKPRLTQLTLVVHDPAPLLVVKRDDQDVTVMIGVTTPVDPGHYTFTASAPDRKTWSQPVDLSAEGATITVDIPPLDKVASTGGPVEHGHGLVVPPPARPAKKPSGTRKLVGLGAAVVGVASTAVGVVFGFQARSLTESAKTACGSDLGNCTGDIVGARADIKDARAKATLANLFVGAGVAVAAVGVYLWLTAPSGGGEHAQAMVVPTLAPDGGGLAIDGHF